jgi:carbon storage regulator
MVEMLVLTRKLGQNIVIGSDISIKILQIDNNKVQIGVQAPTSVSIYRQELFDKVKKQNFASLIRRKRDFLSTTILLKHLVKLKN